MKVLESRADVKAPRDNVLSIVGDPNLPVTPKNGPKGPKNKNGGGNTPTKVLQVKPPRAITVRRKAILPRTALLSVHRTPVNPLTYLQRTTRIPLRTPAHSAVEGITVRIIMQGRTRRYRRLLVAVVEVTAMGSPV